MDFDEFQRLLIERAKSLDYEGRMALGLDICKRLYPEYRSFHNEHSFGNPDILIDSIRYVESGGRDPEQVLTFLNGLEEVCPDSDDFEDAEYALNACGAVSGLLLQVAEPDELDHFIEIAMSYYDTVDGKVQDEDDELTEVEMDNHPLMVEARRFLLQ